jgi:hypothetical protein
MKLSSIKSGKNKPSARTGQSKMSQPQPFYVPPVRHSPEKPEINRSTIYETNSDVGYKNPIDLLEKVYAAFGKFSGVLRKSPGRHWKVYGASRKPPGRHCKSERRSRKPFFSVCVEIQERQNKIIIRGYPKSHDENWPGPYPSPIEQRDAKIIIGKGL